MHPEQLLEIADRVVSSARPGEQVEAVVAWSRDTEVRAYDSEVEHFVSAESAGLGVRVVSGHRQGIAWAGVLDEAAIAETLGDARDNAACAGEDPDAGLAEPDGVAPVELSLYDERLESVPTERKIACALELEAQVRAADPRIRGVESADYGDTLAATAIATSTGIRSAGRESSVYLGTDVLAESGDDTTTGFGFSVARGMDDLDPQRAGADAVERALRMLGATSAPSERLTVVFDPYVTSQLLGLIAEMLSGDAVLRGRSPFAGRVGEVVAAPGVTLLDDATRAASPAASDIDGEGLACRPVLLIEDGVLSGFLHNAYTARASGTVSTGSAQRPSHRGGPSVGPHVATVVPGGLSPEAVLAGVGEGVLVRDLAGLHSGVNPVSGDLSVGAEGQRIRGGELAEPLREVTIASTLQRLLSQVVAIGDDLTLFPWESTGVTLAVADVTMSGR